LYHHVASQIDLKGLKVLEVGSGRGGGSAYISKYLNASEMVGVDISPTAVELCNKIYNINNLTFKLGDSENLPFDDNTFDAIINVESSHCYASMSNFLKEAKRVLKPEGYFIFCDLRRKEYLEEKLEAINSNGFNVIEKKDITQNIIEASIKMTDDRKKAIKNLREA
jgi:ubiquinone/menaquinone biosynthesis C-methylase UbiE